MTDNSAQVGDAGFKASHKQGGPIYVRTAMLLLSHGGRPTNSERADLGRIKIV